MAAPAGDGGAVADWGEDGGAVVPSGGAMRAREAAAAGREGPPRAPRAGGGGEVGLRRGPTRTRHVAVVAGGDLSGRVGRVRLGAGIF